MFGLFFCFCQNLKCKEACNIALCKVVQPMVTLQPLSSVGVVSISPLSLSLSLSQQIYTEYWSLSLSMCVTHTHTHTHTHTQYCKPHLFLHLVFKPFNSAKMFSLDESFLFYFFNLKVCYKNKHGEWFILYRRMLKQSVHNLLVQFAWELHSRFSPIHTFTHNCWVGCMERMHPKA